MTALKPIENRRVRGVAAERYPLNEKCAHPECNEPTADPHHAFPRSLIGGDSWFVEIAWLGDGALVDGVEVSNTSVTPHVAGLCRAHHDDVEEHRAWIKLEDDAFVWYDRNAAGPPGITDEEMWQNLGPLNPQPGSREGKPKRKRFQGEQRRQRRTISLRVPDDVENGGEVWDETLAEVKERLVRAGLYAEGDTIPNYEALIAALRDWLNSPEEEHA